jgi:glycosyltransferase involved in cell wall biosynthesis
MRVLASPAFANRRTNPYNAALYTALQRLGVVVSDSSEKRLLLERWHILHLHWPDGALNSRRAFGAAARILLLVAKLVYAKARGAKIVWTVHNLRAHSGAHPILEAILWRAFLPLVDGAISLSRSGADLARNRFPALAGKLHFVIPHGHYHGAYKNECSRSDARARLGLPAEQAVVAFVGQIKPYKNVPVLVRAFRDALRNGLSATLLIAGKPEDAALASKLTLLADGCADVLFRFGQIAEDDMQFELNACDLAVFPYRDILNSGSAILALSFSRPVLVPAKGAMAELRDLIGADWVMTYDGELTGDVLGVAVRWALNTARPASCNLAPLAWETIAAQTLAAYQAVADSEPVLSCRDLAPSLPR